MLAIVNGAPAVLPIEAIEVGKRTRTLSPANVEKIRASIADVGLLNPLLIWRDDAALKLCAGLHRLEACKALGWANVPVRIVTAEHAAEILLAEVDENLAREELSDVEFALNLKIREGAFLDLKGGKYGRKFETLADLQRYEAGLATAAAFKGEEKAACQVGSPPPDSFIIDTVKKTGKSERAVHRAKARGAIPEVQKLKGTAADSGVVLDSLVAIQSADPLEAEKHVEALAAADAEAKAAKEEADQLEAKAKDEEARKAAERAKAKAVVKTAAVKKTVDVVKKAAVEAKAKKRKEPEPFDESKQCLQECRATLRLIEEALLLVRREDLKALNTKLRGFYADVRTLQTRK